MTEVNAVLPEGAALPAPTPTLESADSNNAAVTTPIAPTTELNSNIAASDLKQQQLTDKENVAVLLKSKEAPTESNMAIDENAMDTEEDDSQITSSTENGTGSGAVDAAASDVNMADDDTNTNTLLEDGNTKDEKSPATTAESSRDVPEEEEQTNDTAANATNEESSNACDEDVISQSCDSVAADAAKIAGGGEELSQNSTAGSSVPAATATNTANDVVDKEAAAEVAEKKLKKVSEEELNSTTTESKQQSEADTSSQEVSSSAENAIANASISEKPVEHKNAAADSSVSNATAAAAAVVPSIVSSSSTIAAKQENGVASPKQKSNDAIVDLDDDDDSDVEMKETVPKDKSAAETAQKPTSKSTENQKNHSACSDSDGAVIIGSDSESESTSELKPVGIVKAADKETAQFIDDDDDDCVVIEDDAPAAALNASDLSKRKGNNLDDSQPPSKRQCNDSQISIRDARSLLPHDSPVSLKRVSDVGIFPINITPAQGIAQPAQVGPPKLVPMSNAAATVTPTSLSLNTNLLPGLTDDMFVLEAPSFIVPYIYEKPPAENLKNILKEIEEKHKLSKEDLAEADKPDEFDMMTEQNKNIKKKKKRFGSEPDESWSEESEEGEEDYDDDSETGMRTKVLIKESNDDAAALKGATKSAEAVVQSVASAHGDMIKPGQENYFENPLGKFFMDIGVGLVQEFVQSDLIRLQKRKMRKTIGNHVTDIERALAALSGNLEASKKKNAPFKFTSKRCEFCNFKTESALAMAYHYETPHMNGVMYKCNFCTFEIRNASEIVYHMEAMHNIRARLVKPLPYHTCANCGFEDNGKAKLARHLPVCAKKFRPDLNLAPPNDWEAPAKIPRIKPRHGLVGTATAYQAMAAQAAAQKAALASMQIQQQQAAQARSIQAAALAAQNVAKQIRNRLPTAVAKPINNTSLMMRAANQVRPAMPTNVVLPNNYQMPTGGQLLQAQANAIAKKTLSGQPSISITPLPRQSAVVPPQLSASTSKMPQAGIKPGQAPGNANNSKAQFVICEICDGYIKDLEQLRNHMQWMHKVKIHPKMIYNRPPLNCQKCQFRFFTDQGLERHLLGSHGLVTSSMQEAANKGKDAGRCPVCGRMYQWKLLNHVSRDHHMTLKPAHLSYKCTVCTATFGMYKQFETHVYTAHSTVAKKSMDGKKNAPASTAGSPSMRNNVSNDSLLKPLKINDEITIIPQPASRSRASNNNNIESHVID